MAVRAKFMCNMWRIRAEEEEEEEVKVMAIERERGRERGGRKKKKKTLEGNHGTWTHSGIMPTTRVVHAEKNAC